MIVFDALPGRAELQEARRPTAPPIPSATEADRAIGRRLALIHDAHRHELASIRALLDRMTDDAGDAEELADAIDGLSMTRHLRLFGALCGRECSHLQFHHDIEEGHTFPTLERRGSDGLRAVIAKLREEHEVVHALIGTLHERAMVLVQAPTSGALDAVREVLDRLDEVVHSHFGYEERELEEALGVHRAL